MAILISLSAIMIGIEASITLPTNVTNFFKVVDVLIVFIFVLDISLRIIGQGKGYFTYYWNIFDFLVVVLAAVTFYDFGGSFAVLRVFRVVRVLLIFSKINQVKRNH